MPDRELKLRSDEVQDIMTYVPGWIVRWGITVVFMTVGMLIAVAWLIKYPDIVKARVTIVSSTPPIDVVARAGGKLRLEVDDQATVTAGTVLAEIENPADFDDVFALKARLDRFKPFFTNPAAARIEFDRTALVGDLQKTYAEFYQNLSAYRQILQHDGGQTSGVLNGRRYGDQISKLVHQRDLLIKELEVAEKKYESTRTLFEKGLASEVNLADAEKAFHEQRTTLEYVEADILFVKRNLVLNIELNYRRLENELNQWQQTYLLHAPIDGTVSFFEFWSDNEYVAPGSAVMTVVPPSYNIIGKVLLPIAGSGKVAEGQKVLIKCDSYPYREYGFVEGRVESISLIPRDNQYMVTVALPGGLVTTYGRDLEFRQEMAGEAMIVTSDLRLIERILYHFRYLFSSGT